MTSVLCCVEPGAAAWDHPVRCIADQEDIAVPEPLGETDPELDRHHVLDRNPQVGLT